MIVGGKHLALFEVNFSRYSSDGITFIICIRVRVCTTVGDDNLPGMMVEIFGHSFTVNFSRYSIVILGWDNLHNMYRVCPTVGDDIWTCSWSAYTAEYRLPLCKTKPGVCKRQFFLQAQWMLPIANRACDGDEMGLYMAGCNTVKYQFHNMPACLASWLCTSSDGRRSLAICFKSSCQFDRRSVDKDSSL